MDRKANNFYSIDLKREKKLWKDSVIIFDTSVLLDFYYYPLKSREDIFNKIFEPLKDRLWI